MQITTQAVAISQVVHDPCERCTRSDYEGKLHTVTVGRRGQQLRKPQRICDWCYYATPRGTKWRAKRTKE